MIEQCDDDEEEEESASDESEVSSSAEKDDDDEEETDSVDGGGDSDTGDSDDDGLVDVYLPARDGCFVLLAPKVKGKRKSAESSGAGAKRRREQHLILRMRLPVASYDGHVKAGHKKTSASITASTMTGDDDVLRILPSTVDIAELLHHWMYRVYEKSGASYNRGSALYLAPAKRSIFTQTIVGGDGMKDGALRSALGDLANSNRDVHVALAYSILATDSDEPWLDVNQEELETEGGHHDLAPSIINLIQQRSQEDVKELALITDYVEWFASICPWALNQHHTSTMRRMLSQPVGKSVSAARLKMLPREDITTEAAFKAAAMEGVHYPKWETLRSVSSSEVQKRRLHSPRKKGGSAAAAAAAAAPPLAAPIIDPSPAAAALGRLADVLGDRLDLQRRPAAAAAAAAFVMPADSASDDDDVVSYTATRAVGGQGNVDILSCAKGDSFDSASDTNAARKTFFRKGGKYVFVLSARTNTHDPNTFGYIKMKYLQEIE